MPSLATIAAWMLVVFIGVVEVVVLWKIIRGTIDLTNLVSESTVGAGKPRASMSRFQLLIFTFVIAVSIVMLTLKNGVFPDLGADVLALIGISGGSYVVSKGIQASENVDITRIMVRGNRNG